MRPPLNLATRPLRNKNLPRVLVGLVWAGLFALTVKHALVVRRLLPSRTTALYREVTDLEARVKAKLADVSRLRTDRVDPPTLKRWTLIKELVDRRQMSWTRLFAVLEEVLPWDARLVSIAPRTKGGRLQLVVQAVVQSTESGIALVETLEERPEFDSVVPVTWSTTDRGEEVQYQMAYRPAAAPPPATAPAAARPGQSEEPADGDVPPSPPPPPRTEVLRP